MNQNHNWEKIYKAQAPKLLGVCRRYIHDLSMAEDVMHNAFEKAMQKEKLFKNEGPVEAWLYRIVVNEALQFIKQNKKINFTDENLLIDTSELEDKEIENRFYTQDELLEVLEILPIAHKTVFNLYVLENFSHIEIANSLNISVNTSKSHLHRARLKLKEILLNKEKKKRRIAGFFLLTITVMKIDDIYKESFQSYEIPLKKAFIFPKSKGSLRKKVIKWSVFGFILFGISIIFWLNIDLIPNHIDKQKNNKTYIINNNRKNQSITNFTKENISEIQNNNFYSNYWKNIDFSYPKLYILNITKHQHSKKNLNNINLIDKNNLIDQNNLVLVTLNKQNIDINNSLNANLIKNQSNNAQKENTKIISKIILENKKSNIEKLIDELTQKKFDKVLKNSKYKTYTSITKSDTSSHIIVKKTTIRRDTIYVYQD